MRPRIGMMFIALIVASANAGAAPLSECASMYESVGMPQYQGEDNDDPAFVKLCRKGYVLSHNGERKEPDWVLERLTPARFQGNGTRDESFKADEELQAGQRSELSDYRGSGYDRGHMAPAADMKFSQAATTESFLLSNMTPQIGIGFNRGIWARLEDQVRVWATHRGDVVAITGPVYGEKTIGASKVAVPTHFFKIVYEPARRRAIALLLPNKKISGQDLKPYLTSIDHVEELTGLKFLPDLPSSIQRRVKRNVASLWQQ